MTTSGSNITNIGGAYGTGVNLVGVSPTWPQLAIGMGPQNQNMMAFASASAQQGTFTQVTSSHYTVYGVMSIQGAATDLWYRGLSSVEGVFILANRTGFSVRVSGLLTVPVPFAMYVNGSAAEACTISIRTFAVVIDLINHQAWTYIDGRQGPVVTDAVNLTGTLTLKTLGLATDALMGPQLLYTGLLQQADINNLDSFFSPFMATTLYASSSIGNDSTSTPWKTTAGSPYASLAALMAAGRPGQTLALKGDDIFRIQIITDIPSQGSAGMPGNPIVLDGGVWGNPINNGLRNSPKARIRYSSAPAVSLVSGTVYSCGVIAPNYAPWSSTVTYTLSNLGVPFLALYTDGIIYKSLQAGNLNHPPTGLPGDLWWVAAPPQDSYPTEIAAYIVPGGQELYAAAYANPSFYASVPLNNKCISPLPQYSANVIRLTQATAYPPTPGTWWLDVAGTVGLNVVNTLYVNGGMALNNGDVEVPTQVNNKFNFTKSDWTIQNLVSGFAWTGGPNIGPGTTNATGASLTGPTDLLFNAVEINFHNNDGLDTHGFDATNGAVVTLSKCFSGWNGPTLANGILSIGDGSACHEASHLTALNCIYCMNDATNGPSGHPSTFATMNACLSIGRGLRFTTNPPNPAAWDPTVTYTTKAIGVPYLALYNNVIYASLQTGNLNHQPDVSPSFWAISPPPFTGIMRVTNNIFILPPGQVFPIAINQEAQGGPATVQAYNNTLVALAGAGSIGMQIVSATTLNGVPAVIDSKNNIVYGWSNGVVLANPTGWNGDYNCYFANGQDLPTTVNYGTHSVKGDPQFISSPTNVSVRNTSPCTNAGIGIGGVNTDFLGVRRPIGQFPTIGAFEVVPVIMQPSGGSSGIAHGNTYERGERDDEEEAAVLLLM